MSAVARIEADREDLMAEAVALFRRVEFALVLKPPEKAPAASGPDDSKPSIVVGFRQNGWFSIYLGPDLMYQFDADGRLRRAFSTGLLYRTQGTTLARMRRERTQTQTVLVRQDLNAQELNEFRHETLGKIAWFSELLDSSELVVRRRIPEDDGPLVDDIRQFLSQILNSSDFLAPAIPGKS